MSFVLTSCTVEGSGIAVQEPDKPARQHQLKAGEILYGRWAQGAHCNEKMPPSVVGGPLKGRCRSWTLYLDYRILARNYVTMHNTYLELFFPAPACLFLLASFLGIRSTQQGRR